MKVFGTNFKESRTALGISQEAFADTCGMDRMISINSLKIKCDSTKISTVAEDEKEYAYWTREQLKKAFEKKYKNKFVYAKAEIKAIYIAGSF